MDPDSVKESAKATQEVAKTTKKGLEVAEKVGGFIAEHVGGTIEQGMGIFEDKLKYYRATNQLEYIAKFNARVQELGITSLRPITLKTAIPLLEAASLEDDEYLQNMWVNLLINSSIEQDNFHLQRSHINILEQLTSLEAKSLNAIYAVGELPPERNTVLTAELPYKVEVVKERDINNSDLKPKEPSEEIMIALANLARLRLIMLPTTFGGGEIYHHINHSLLGRRFVAACTIGL